MANLELADLGETSGELEVDLLVGSDHYWSIVTGRVIRGPSGPVATETQFDWVLSGPIQGTFEDTMTLSVVSTSSTHLLRADTTHDTSTLSEELKRFRDLESLGILNQEATVKESFTQQIVFKQGRYEVHLPWKETHPPLLDNYVLSLKRLKGLLTRLNSDLINSNGMMLSLRTKLSKVWWRKLILLVIAKFITYRIMLSFGMTNKASARKDGPSLNDCLYTGPNFGQSVLVLLLRLRLHKVALIGDIEKAFLMVSVLRFLWIRDPSDPQSEVITLRFTCVVFGVSASPFLLNATVDYHMQRYVELDPDFVMKFRRSIYVDDVAASFPDDDSAYEFYVKSKTRLAEANFNLSKFQTNSSDLRQRIKTDEGGSESSSAGAEECQVLGIRWNIEHDKLIFDFGDICDRMRSADPTKRNAVSLATRFFDPLGVLSPITIRFKMLFQQLCREGVGWDEPLKGESLALWNRLSADLDYTQTVDIPRLYKARVSDVVTAVRLVGYCDASKKAYAATVYL